jgi:hypothetical protein
MEVLFSVALRSSAVRAFLAFAVTVSVLVSTSGSANAGTYGTLTLTVPVTIDVPKFSSGKLVFQLYCREEYQGKSKLIKISDPLPVTVGPDRITYAGDVPLKLAAGLHSGGTVECWMHIDGATSAEIKAFFAESIPDELKTRSRTVLP